MILITGATGTVGSEVVKRLSAQGIQVRAVTRDPRKVDAQRLSHVHVVHGDFEDVESMRRAGSCAITRQSKRPSTRPASRSPFCARLSTSKAS